MVIKEENEKKVNKVTYEINNKKYTVITSCIETVQNIDKLYEVICRYAISQIKQNLYICN